MPENMLGPDPIQRQTSLEISVANRASRARFVHLDELQNSISKLQAPHNGRTNARETPGKRRAEGAASENARPTRKSDMIDGSKHRSCTSPTCKIRALTSKPQIWSYKRNFFDLFRFKFKC